MGRRTLSLLWSVVVSSLTITFFYLFFCENAHLLCNRECGKNRAQLFRTFTLEAHWFFNYLETTQRDSNALLGIKKMPYTSHYFLGLILPDHRGKTCADFIPITQRSAGAPKSCYTTPVTTGAGTYSVLDLPPGSDGSPFKQEVGIVGFKRHLLDDISIEKNPKPLFQK